MTEPTDRLRRYGEDIASAVSPARSRVAAMRAVGQAQRTPPRRAPRLALATVGGFVALNVVAAGVANGAVPGDLLYPLDRGYERAADLIGLGGDRTEERIEEAEHLLERSDLEGAVDLIAEATGLESVEGAAASLEGLEHPDPDLPEHVHDLMRRVDALVEARREGESRDLEEAEAAVDLLATQIREQARAPQAEEAGPPDHAAEPGPPATLPDPTIPADNPGRADPGPPASTPGNDRPGPPEDVQGRPDPGGPPGGESQGGTGGAPGQGGGGGQAPADPGRSGGR